MKKFDGTNALSLVAFIGVAVFSLASNLIESKKTDAMITEKVQKAIAEMKEN